MYYSENAALSGARVGHGRRHGDTTSGRVAYSGKVIKVGNSNACCCVRGEVPDACCRACANPTFHCCYGNSNAWMETVPLTEEVQPHTGPRRRRVGSIVFEVDVDVSHTSCDPHHAAGSHCSGKW